MITISGTLSKAWLAKALGVAFDRDYYFDPNRRYAIDSQCNEYAAEHFDVPAIVKEEVKADAILPLNELTSQFRNLRPFGEANPSPLFISPKTLWAGKESDILYTIDENLRVHIKATTPST